MSDAVKTEIEGKVARVTLNDGKANAFSNAMFDAVNNAIDAADAAKAVLVLRGKPGNFSGGYDLKTLMQGPEAARELVKRGSDLAVRFMRRPHPVILVSDGHCVALGAFLFMGADYRIGLKGDFKIGLPETPNSLPMHNFGREIAAYSLTQPIFKRAFIHGEMFDADGAVAAGFYDESTADVDAAIEAAVARLSKINTPIYANNKAVAFKTILPVLEKAIEDDLKMGINL
jgi:enoyl-CoA hydratase